MGSVNYKVVALRFLLFFFPFTEEDKKKCALIGKPSPGVMDLSLLQLSFSLLMWLRRRAVGGEGEGGGCGGVEQCKERNRRWRDRGV